MVTKTSLAKDKIQILLLEGVHPRAIDALKQDGYHHIENLATSLPEEALMEKIKNVHIIGIRSRTQLSEKVLKQANKLIAIGCFCIGTNQVDLEAAQKLGIAVFNAPFANTRSVAELVLAEIIMLMRGIPEKNAAAHRGQWMKSAKDSHEIRNKTLGIVGYGHIGTQVGILAENFGMQVLYYDIEPKLAIGNAKPAASLDALLSQSDIVTLHVPQTPQTKNMITAAALEKMQAGSLLINASRGTVVDINALAAALESNHLRGAAIDVFPIEPKSNQEPFSNILTKFENVLLTPHIGGSTLEAQQNIGTAVANRLMTYSNNGSTLGAVNFPEVSLPEHAGRCRLLHIHRNIPGILKQINEIFSKENINILGQYLQTSSEIGYVVMDVDIGAGPQAFESLKQIDGTIRARMLY